jgi:hypothetical protein
MVVDVECRPHDIMNKDLDDSECLSLNILIVLSGKANVMR